jgi:hypothetical protein
MWQQTVVYTGFIDKICFCQQADRLLNYSLVLKPRLEMMNVQNYFYFQYNKVQFNSYEIWMRFYGNIHCELASSESLR